jgi:hypothetical protein
MHVGAAFAGASLFNWLSEQEVAMVKQIEEHYESMQAARQAAAAREQ